MKRFKLVSTMAAAAAALCLVAGSAMAAGNPFVPKAPPFKTAIVKYTLKGTATGTEVLYVKGMERAQHTNSKTSILGMTSEQKTITITKPKEIINIDLAEMRGTSSGNIQHYMAQEYDKLSSKEQAIVRKNAEGLGQNLAAMLPGSDMKKRKGTFMGKPVEIITVMGLTSYIWQEAGILLKTTGSIGPMKMNVVASSLKTNVSLPGSAFAVPAGIKVVWDDRADQQQRKMAKQWIDNLKDPEFGKKGSRSGMGAMVVPPEVQQQRKSAPADDDGEMSADEAVDQGMKMLKSLFD